MPHALHSFILAARAKGATDDFLRSLLVAEGWPEARVNGAFKELYVAETGQDIPASPASVHEAARDAFFYLLAFTTLGIWSISLGSMLFVFINRAYPDTTHRYMSTVGISVELASIIVALPIFFIVSRLIGNDLLATPEKLESGVRKWITYVALFFAAGVAIGDLITFLATLLDGDLTARFVLKVLTVLLIAGGIFWHYLTEARRHPVTSHAEE